MTYIILVVMCYLGRGYHEEKIPDDHKWNVAPETSVCRSLLWEASLMGRGSGQPMKQYSNIWLLESAKTVMYDSTVLNHADCFHFLTSQMLTIKSKRILVIYDKEKQKELLIIRN